MIEQNVYLFLILMNIIQKIMVFLIFLATQVYQIVKNVLLKMIAQDAKKIIIL